jgi:outer membrane protein assembly factor BamB
MFPAVVAAALAMPLSAADWPQWRGPGRDGRVVGLAPRASWPEALKPAWKVTVGEGHASPVVASGRIYVFARLGEEEVLHAIDLTTGKMTWRQSYPAPYTVNPAASGHGKGPKSTPVVGEGCICTLGIGGILSCFEAASGKRLWNASGKGFAASSPQYGAAMSPLVDRGLLIAHVGGEDDGALTAFELKTGVVRWAWKGDGPAYASPVVSELAGRRQVITQTRGHLVGVSADRGELLWKVPFATPYGQNAVTPVVSGDLVIYSGLEQPVRALRVVKQGAGFATAPAWENAEVAAYMSAPVLADGRLCGLSHRKKGQLFCLEAATGKTAWLSEGRQGDNAALLSLGATLLVLSTEGELVVAPASGASFSPVRRYTVAASPTWAHPVVVDEGVLVKDAQSLALLRF